MANEITKYMSNDVEVVLTDDTIRQYLVSGNGKITDQELVMFKKLCQAQKLNPFLREIYLIKYGDKFPATMVTGKETFLKRACRNSLYKGHKTGLSEDGKIAWAEVYKEGYEVPIRCEVDFDEYVGLKDGQPNKMWTSKPRTMLKKVALVQALRESFPDDLGGLYSQEEINSISQELPTEEIKQARAGVIDNNFDIKEPMPRQTPETEVASSTQKQVKLIYVLLSKLNINDDLEKHEKVSGLLGLDEAINSMNDLTKEQAGTIITALQEMGDA